MLLCRVGDCVMHLCPFCNRRTINVLDDDDDDDDDWNKNEPCYLFIPASRMLAFISLATN